MPRQKLTQRSDGRYRCKYKGKEFYGDTPREAQAKREEYKRMLEAGMKAEAMGLTVRSYAMRWVCTYKAHLTDGPYNTHVRMLNRFCDHEDIGSRRIQDIDTIDVQDFYNSAEGKSYSYICDMRDTIKGLFKFALADRIIQYDPTIKAKLPKGKKGTHRAIALLERELISKLDHRMRPAAMAMLYAGLRRGEAMALDIDRDVDFANKTITVRYAVRFPDQNHPALVDPKTEAGARTIPLLDVLADELNGKHGLLIADASGNLMSEHAWSRAWESYLVKLSAMHNGCAKRWYGKTKEHKAIIAAGEHLPPWEDISIRPHDLRHSYCTMLYDAGVDLKTAQLWMGHADADVTMRIYTHLTAERQIKATKDLEKAAKNLYGGQNGGQT
jgi:integrase